MCHQLPERSPHDGAAVFPVCFRCAGLHLGLAASYLGLFFSNGWRARFPSVRLAFVFAAMMLPLMIDGAGNALYFWNSLGWWRGLTGLGVGLALPWLLTPLAHTEESIQNPKSESPKSERNPKSENGKGLSTFFQESTSRSGQSRKTFGIRISDFFRASVFGLRISDPIAEVSRARPRHLFFPALGGAMAIALLNFNGRPILFCALAIMAAFGWFLFLGHFVLALVRVYGISIARPLCDGFFHAKIKV